MLPDALRFISGDYHDDDDDDHHNDDHDDDDSLTPWNIFLVMIRMILSQTSWDFF